MHGTLFHTADLIMTQEMKIAGAGRSQFERWARGQGWDAVLVDAYTKNTGLGGGAAVLAKGEGVRHACKTYPPECQGRLALAYGDLDGACIVGTVYGVSGCKTAAQVLLWRCLVQLLTALALPFVIGGDWQVQPCEMARMGLDRVLGAKICASGLATNAQPGNEIDYFLVSECLTDKGWAVARSVDCSFEPHRPAVLTLQGRRRTQATRRITRPKRLPIARPIGPLLPMRQVAWDTWEEGDALEADGPLDKEAMDKAVQTWYAGVEVELMSALGVSGDEATACSGIGTVPRIVEESTQRRYRSSPDVTGIIGQRLTWAARAIHRVISAVDIDMDPARRRRLLEEARAFGHRAPQMRRDMEQREVSGDIMVHRELAIRAMRLIATFARRTHGQPPVVDLLIMGVPWCGMQRARHGDGAGGGDAEHCHHAPPIGDEGDANVGSPGSSKGGARGNARGQFHDKQNSQRWQEEPRGAHITRSRRQGQD